ncbi:signal peptidase II [Peptoniphilus olsenii]|uniref:Lipoprotein signal peptidase n=1 Tax=Peptoniphilus olsenii TaxID=411570 RepID=A0ABV2J955_9FIRM
MFVILFSIILILLDQFSKFLVKTYLYGKDPLVVIDGFLRFYYIENRGAAFGILQGARWFLTIITIIVLIFLLIFLIKNYKKLPKIYLFSISLLIGGTIGNFIDRLRLHYVIDFISLKFFDYNFAVFNLADTFIVVGTILICIGIILHDNPRISSKRENND